MLGDICWDNVLEKGSVIALRSHARLTPVEVSNRLLLTHNVMFMQEAIYLRAIHGHCGASIPNTSGKNSGRESYIIRLPESNQKSTG